MKLRITVEGVAYEVDVEVIDGGLTPAAPAATSSAQKPREAASSKPHAASVPKSLPKQSPPRVAASPAGGKTLPSPLPGTIVEVNVKAGQQVKADDTLMMIDAMKMFSPILAPRAGTVKAVFVKSGDVVSLDQALIEFE